VSRRPWIAAPTLAIALVVAIALPTAQLRTFVTIHECCCPDPDSCHCFDHKTDGSTMPTMRTCHAVSRDVVAPAAPGFVVRERTAARPIPRRVVVAQVTLPAPHDAPDPTRPAAPS